MGNLRIEQTDAVTRQKNQQAIESNTKRKGIIIFDNESNMNTISKILDKI